MTQGHWPANPSFMTARISLQPAERVQSSSVFCRFCSNQNLYKPAQGYFPASPDKTAKRPI
jgi:hypothetical protein